jgi:hypothetical protein
MARNRESLLYFIAAGLFALAAAISIYDGRSLDLGSVLELVAAAAFAWMGVMRSRSKAG